MNQRSFVLGLVCVILLVMLALLFAPKSPWYMYRSTQTTVTSTLEVPISPADLEASWQDSVETALSSYDTNHDAAKAKAFLLAAKVPGDKREIHLALVLAFDAILNKQVGAEEQLQKVIGEYRALPKS